MYLFHAGYYWSVARRKPDRSKFPLRDVSQIVKYNQNRDQFVFLYRQYTVLYARSKLLVSAYLL
jgi:hypothetical protein